MLDNVTAETIAQARRELREGARVHRRSANAHRRAARSLMKAYAQLDKLCEEYGIRLEITQTEESK